jgi:hypothetical protein
MTDVRNIQGHLVKIELTASNTFRRILIMGYDKDQVIEDIKKIRAHLDAMEKDL